jgi:hypothetical protein
VIESFSTVFGSVLISLLFLNLITTACLFLYFRSASSKIEKLTRETYGLYRKIEGLTADERGRFKIQFSELKQTLTKELPPTIAAKAGTLIFEAESEVLRRLAEIEPNIRGDREAQKKMHDLIQKMEKLEATLIGATSDAVRSVLEQREESYTERAQDIRRFAA